MYKGTTNYGDARLNRSLFVRYFWVIPFGGNWWYFRLWPDVPTSIIFK